MEFEPTNSTQQQDDNDNNLGWQTVTYKKHNNRKKHASNGPTINNNNINNINNSNVFSAIDKQSEERRKVLEAATRLLVDDPDPDSDPDPKKVGYEGSDEEEVVESSVGVVEKKKKVKKVKKVKVSVVEAAAKIDAGELAGFLVDVTASFEEQDIQVMRFADYFGRAFSNVAASQFPWVKLFRESSVAKIADNPISHISEAVYKTSVDWINKRSTEAIRSFLIWSLDSVVTDLESQLGGPKGPKGLNKGAQNTSSKSQVGLFVVLAMVLRRKPDALITILSNLNETLKQNAQDKLPVIVWMVTQASQGDLAVGLYMWSRLILPIVGTKSGSNPQTRDLILQLVERILSAPKAKTILVNAAVRKGERLVPPSALDLLMRTTFPSSSARIKATERFEAVYPTLKNVALAGTPGSKAMKQVYKQIINISLKASGEGIPELSNEASNIFIWCITQNPDSCKQWETVYSDNLKASIIILKRLNEQWKELSQNQSFLEAFTQTLKSLKKKNEKAITGDKAGDQAALYREADKYCKVLLGRSSRGWGCAKATVLLVVAFGVGGTFLAPNALESLDWNKLSEVINIQKFV